jgi:predicted  nucleic acid-binding Zn-ribbon protein
MKKYKGFAQLLIFSILFCVTLNPTSVLAVSPADASVLGVGGAKEDELEQLQQQIRDIQNQRKDIQSQLNSNNYTLSGYNSQIARLFGEAQVYQKEIDELNLQIKQLEINIATLEEEIKVLKEDILKRQDEITGLEKESTGRIKNSYMNFRMYGMNFEVGTNVIFNDSINSYFKNSQYKEVIQSDTNDMLVTLFNLKVELESKKESLNEKLTLTQNDKAQIDIKLADVNEKKGDLDVKLSAYYAEVDQINRNNAGLNGSIASISDQESKLRAKAELIRQEIIGGYTPISAGQFVLAGTIIGNQGMTGYATGPHLHFSVYENGALQDPCNYVNLEVNGCNWGSRLQKPIRGEYYYTSGYGMRWGVMHGAIDVAGVPWNTPVYAAHDGYARKGVENCSWAPICNGGGALYIIICEDYYCNSGLKTGYWHLSQY